MKEDVYLRIKAIVSNILDEECVIRKESLFVNDLGFDSVNLLYLQVAVEDEFDIRFDPVLDDFSAIFKDIISLCSYIEEKVGE